MMGPSRLASQSASGLASAAMDEGSDYKQWSLDENRNCQKTDAIFRLSGEGLVVAEVTKRLGMEPTWAAEKGELKAGPGLRRPRVRRRGVWFIGSEDAVASTSSERHLLYLLERVEPVAERIAEVVREQGLAVDFFSGWFSASGHGGPSISPDALRRIAALDAVLGYDFYDFSGQDDAEEEDRTTSTP